MGGLRTRLVWYPPTTTPTSSSVLSLYLAPEVRPSPPGRKNISDAAGERTDTHTHTPSERESAPSAEQKHTSRRSQSPGIFDYS